MISPVIAARVSQSRKQTAPATGTRIARDPNRAGHHRARGPRASRTGDAARGDRLDRACRDEVHADAARPEVAREVARDALERRLGDAHPVVDRPRDARVEVEPDDRRRSLPPRAAGASAAASALSENALVSKRHDRAAALGVSRKPPPSASAGANAIACSTPSSAPQRAIELRRDRGEVLGLVDVQLEHVGGSAAADLAARSVRRMPRPKPVRMISAPSSCAWRATSNAIEPRVRTPVMSSRLPSSMRRHSGMFPSGRRAAAPSRARQTRRRSRARVSPGAITSSTWPSALAARRSAGARPRSRPPARRATHPDPRRRRFSRGG